MMLVIHELEVLVLISENARRAAADQQLRRRERRARELQVRLLEMIQVQVAVAAGPDERAELAVSIRPLVPDRDPVLAQPGDVGVAAQEPQQLVHHRAYVDLPGGDQREAAGEIEAHLVRKHRQRAGAGAVALAHALGPDPTHQLQVLLHCSMAKLPEGARTQYAHTNSAPPAMTIGADNSCPSVSQPPAR